VKVAFNKYDTRHLDSITDRNQRDKPFLLFGAVPSLFYIVIQI